MIHLKIIPHSLPLHQRFQELAKDDDVATRIPYLSHPCTMASVDSLLGSIQGQFGLFKTLGIFQDHKLVGAIQSAEGHPLYHDVAEADRFKASSMIPKGEFNDPRLKILNINFWIGKEYWGQGITTKALGLFLKHLRSQRSPSERVYLVGEHSHNHPIAGKILKRNGMTPVLEYEREWDGESLLTVRYERVLG